MGLPQRGAGLPLCLVEGIWTMRRFAILVALCCISVLAQAKGVPFAVESFGKAQELSKIGSKHTLVFYTADN